MRRPGLRRVPVVLIAVALAGIGLRSAWSYWEAYYQHRGFATVADLPHARRGHPETIHFRSGALHREADYLVYLPPGYSPRHRYPVYYLLHGSPGRPQVYYAIASLGVRMDNLISEHRMRPMLLVYPDGRIGGSTYSDSEWANTRVGAFESYVLEVVRDVDARFATRAGRGERVIAGFSAGAYGAADILVHHPAVFGNLQAWSGYFTQTPTGVFAGASRATLAYDSPLAYVRRHRRRLASEPVRAFLFTGRDDNASPQLKPMADALAAAGAAVRYALYRGGHDWQLWHAHLNQLLVLASRDVSTPLRAGNGIAGTLTPGVKPIPRGLGRHRHRHPHRHRHRHRRHGLRQAAGRRRRAPVGRVRRPRPSSAAAAGVPALIVSLTPVAARPGRRRRSEPSRLGTGVLLGGLLLALGSAALINLGFLLQHRGFGARTAGLAAGLRGAVRNRLWLAGQALGWLGFAAQIAAVAIAPLSLVQAFAAGGLALSVPLAARAFGHRITRAQLVAVLMIAASLAALPIGIPGAADRLHGGALMLSVSVALLAGLALSVSSGRGRRAIAAGIFYGAADAAIKAISVGWRAHGISAVLSGWAVVAALATFAGFLSFQAALQRDEAIASISLMTALVALVALACGLIAFGESLGAGPVAVLAHLAAIAVVLGCVPVLAAAQARMASVGQQPEPRGVSPVAAVEPG